MLSADQIEVAAKTLAEGATPDLKWDALAERYKDGYRRLVKRLAAPLHTDNVTPEAFTVFLAWMGDDDAMTTVQRMTNGT